MTQTPTDELRQRLVKHFRSRMTPPIAAPETLAQEGFIDRWNARADKKAEDEADAILALLHRPTQDVRECPRCKGTGDDPVQGHPDHSFKCDLCDGHKFIRIKSNASTQDAAPAHGLTEEERKLVEDFKQAQREYPNASFASKWHNGLLAIIDRLTGAQQ